MPHINRTAGDTPPLSAKQQDSLEHALPPAHTVAIILLLIPEHSTSLLFVSEAFTHTL